MGEGFTAVAAGPCLANTASWRALGGAGFGHVADVVHDGDTEPWGVMHDTCSGATSSTVRSQQPKRTDAPADVDRL